MFAIFKSGRAARRDDRTSTQNTRAGRALRSAAKAVIESLEQRQMLSVYTVTSETDTHVDGLTTLREAVAAANASVGTDTVAFDIAGSGVHVITLDSSITATEAVEIDGYTQTGASRNTKAVGTDAVLKIQLEGTFDSSALLSLNGGSTISGIAFAGHDNTNTYEPVLISGEGNSLLGNYFGFAADGTTAKAFIFDEISVTGANNIIGTSNVADRNVVGNGRTGIILYIGSDGTKIQNNYIGTDATGATAARNLEGITTFAYNAVIGGTQPGEGNVISANSSASIEVDGGSGSRIQGNRIGTDASGLNPLGNDVGVWIAGSPTGVLVGGTAPGAGNIIAYNGTGVGMSNEDRGAFTAETSDNSVLGNSIFGNTKLGIDLVAALDHGGGFFTPDGVTANDAGDADAGPNDLTNFPVITNVYADQGSDTSWINGTLNALPSTTYAIEFFSSPSTETNPQARTFVGRITVTTDAGGNAAFSASFDGLIGEGDFVTATATQKNGSKYLGTSEISAGVRANGISGLGTSIFTTTPTVTEGDSGTMTVTFTVNISGGYPVPVKIDYRTADLEATAGEDYVPASGTLSFALGETSKTFTVTVKGDTKVEGDERFQGVINYNGVDSFAEVKILNDDSAAVKVVAPTNLTGSAVSYSQVKLNWTDKSANETGFEVQYSTSSTFSSPTNVTVPGGPNVTTYTVPGLNASTYYYFRVRALGTINSDYSNSVKIKTLAAPKLALPTNFVAKALAGGSVKLTWTDKAAGEIGYEIEVSTVYNFATLVSDVTVNTPNLATYTVTGLSKSTYYYFRVRAVSATPALDSDWTSGIKLKTLSA